jgi:cytochrome c553
MEYQKIVLFHRIVVSLFLLHYVWKGFLLISNKKDTLTGYTAKTRIAEIILSLLFLGTGIYLMWAGPALSVLQWIKIALVFASIPLAVIGFKRSKKPLAMASILFLVAAYGLAEASKAQYAKADKAPVDTSKVQDNPVAVGQAIYKTDCIACHGDHGDAGLSGAKNLKMIKNGVHGTSMGAFSGLSDDQLNGLVAYIKTLKQ